METQPVNHELSPEAESLRSVPFFENLTSDDLQRIASVGNRRTFQPGEAIVAKDEAGGGLFVIVSGAADVHVGGKDHELGPGAFFGEMSLLANRPRSATVTARDPTEVLTIEAMYFKPFLIKNPSLAVTILAGVAERLREIQERVDGMESAETSEA
jgi:CRP-like cAMP-binding protein